MSTTIRLLLVLRPLQVILICAFMVIAGVEQEYCQWNTIRLVIILAGGIPVTLLALSVAIHTVWVYVEDFDHSHRVGTIRWVVDFVLFLLLGSMAPLLIMYGPGAIDTSAPLDMLSLVLVSTAAASFIPSWILLIIEDVQLRRTKPLLVEVCDKYQMTNAKQSFDSESIYARHGVISQPKSIADPLAYFTYTATH